MKKLLYFAFFLCAGTLLRAQLPDGSIAPNFMATDINGNMHSLYDLLDAGKTVVMDVSATWCGPCWGYHQSHALENIWEEYGPTGTDDMYVLFVEGDASTDMDCLMGNTAACPMTQGDWIAGTPYPIIDDASIAEAYETTFFPTIFVICPDRRLRMAGQLPPAELRNFANNCPQAAGINNGSIFDLKTGTHSDYYCGPTTIYPKISIQNLGSQPLNSAELTLSVNGTPALTKNWTGSLNTFDFEEVAFDPYTFNSDEFLDIQISLTKVNGNADDHSDNNVQLTTLVPNGTVIEETKVRFEMRNDGNAEEIRWEFRAPDGSVLYSGGNPNAQPGANTPNLIGGYSPNAFIKDTFTLTAGPGCYEFYIIDDGGNGLSGDAYYKLQLLDGTDLIQGGNFDDIHGDWINAENIQVGSSNLQLSATNAAAIAPNPTTGLAQLTWDRLTFEPSAIVVRDACGSIVLQTAIQGKNGQMQIDATTLAKGFYTVQIQGTEGNVVRKMVKY